MIFFRFSLLFLFLISLALEDLPLPADPATNAPAAAAPAPPPVPTYANISYGPAPDQLMDVYLPPTGAGPFPVVIWYGGVFAAKKYTPPLNKFFPAHIAAVSVETRSLPEAVKDKADPPISYVMLDARRAVQFVRLHAPEWKLDPQRIALGGGSQGTLPALYVACSGEKADPKSADPVERESTKVTCVGALRSQPSIDPKVMQEWVPGVQWGAPSLGGSFADSLQKRDALLPVIVQWSPDALITRDAPPIYFYYNWGLTEPPGVKEADYKVHSPLWGLGFQKVAQSRGATCYLEFPGHPSGKYQDCWDFFVQQLMGATP